MAAQEAIKNKGVALDADLVTKAVHALLKHHELKTGANNALLGNESNIHLLVSLVVSPKEASSKHHTIVLPHAVYKDLNNDAEVCLIVKNDETKKDIQELQSQLAELLQPVKKILTLTSLRSKHGDYAQRRTLMKRYTMFLVDDRITPMMPKALGRDFIRKHKLPLPIKITGKSTTNLANALQRGIRSTYYTVSAGSCVSIKVAVTTMSPIAVVDNILTASRLLHFPTKAVQNICIKTPESAALPIYNQTPEQLYDIIALARVAEEEAQAKQEDNNPVAADPSPKSAIKSPLLKALKKQKKIEQNNVNQPAKEQKSATEIEKTNGIEEKEKEVKVEIKNEKDALEVKEDDKEAKKSKKKRRNKSTETLEAKNIESKNEVTAVQDGSSKKQNEPKKKKKGDTETLHSSEESKTLEKSKDDTKLAKGNEDSGKKRTKNEEDSPLPTKKNKVDSAADFWPAEKYTESKKGYVFKKGPKGLGYYGDTKPVVNKMAMDALRRSFKSSTRGSAKPQSKTKTSSSKRRR